MYRAGQLKNPKSKKLSIDTMEEVVEAIHPVAKLLSLRILTSSTQLSVKQMVKLWLFATTTDAPKKREPGTV